MQAAENSDVRPLITTGAISSLAGNPSSPLEPQTLAWQPLVASRGTASLPPYSDFEATLRILADKIVRILQADSCAFLLHDAVTGTLYPTEPAHGFQLKDLEPLRRRVSEPGISSEVFRSNAPVVLYDALTDPRALAEGLAKIGVRNGVSVPLIVEKRDEQNRVVERTIVGVLHVFNKHQGEDFTDEDVGLLRRMAMQAAAIISTAEAYREVAQEKHELIQTIDNLFAGLIMVAQNGRLLQVNSSARAILGINHNYPLVGVPYFRAIPIEKVRNLLDRALGSDGEEVVDEITVNLSNGSGTDSKRIYQIQCSPMRDNMASVSGVVAIFTDITEIRGLEQLKSAFIDTVSHELRTPLTSIKGFISTLLADRSGFYTVEQQREFLEIIDTECDRLTRLIKDLLDVSRIEKGQAMRMHLEAVDFPALVQKVLVAQRIYARNHTLSMEFSPDFPPLEGDADKLDQIMTNLVNNAIKYSPNGGTIRVVGRAVPPDRRYVQIDVSDEGMGVAKEHLPKLFNNFYRVDNRDNRDIGGTGIGLALVKALVEKHHGAVTMESELGRGSTVRLTLPVFQTSREDGDDTPAGA